MATTQLEAADFTVTKYAAACAALRIDPLYIPGRHGHTVAEIEKTWTQALKDERAGKPMPTDVPSYQWSLLREFRVLAKRALQDIQRYDNEIDRMCDARLALLKSLGLDK